VNRFPRSSRPVGFATSVARSGLLAGSLWLIAACGSGSPDAQAVLEAHQTATGEPGIDGEPGPAGNRRLRIGYALGADDAPVQVVEFSDPGCTSCAHFTRRSFAELRQEFVETGRVQWRYVTLDRGFPNGVPAARAGACAARQDRFWEMRARLAQDQRDWIGRRDPGDRFRAYAADLGLDAAAFADCLDEPDRRGTGMSVNEMVAVQLGIRAVPTFLVNGRPVIGALGTEQFRGIVLEALGE
jgi:protein-disulfide isomerase